MSPTAAKGWSHGDQRADTMTGITSDRRGPVPLSFELSNLDAVRWLVLQPGRSVAVVTPLVARALLVHALGAAPEVIFRIDIAPLGRALISRSQQTWRLTSLEPVKDNPRVVGLG